MTLICTICARGGSKGLPGKNMRMIAGKPLIQWTIEEAQAAAIFDAIAVSSDDAATLEWADGHGCSGISRPAEMATDEAPKMGAIQHAAQTMEGFGWPPFDTIVDLDVSCPLRIPGDIILAVGMCEAKGPRNVLSVSPARRSPYYNIVEMRGGKPEIVSTKWGNSAPIPVTRRQDAPETYDCNGSILVWQRVGFFEAKDELTKGAEIYVMPRERAWDIDDELDFKIVEMLLKERAGG
jgi:N-acylneuraminate cytidylyltransferase/CMP-N,N'-diacetyllegionaminic acid synthase